MLSSNGWVNIELRSGYGLSTGVTVYIRHSVTGAACSRLGAVHNCMSGLHWLHMYQDDDRSVDYFRFTAGAMCHAVVIATAWYRILCW